MVADHKVVVVDPRLLRPPFEVGDRGWFGSDVSVVVPASFKQSDIALSLPEATILVTAHEPVTAGMMDLAPRLELVAKPGTGVDNIDVSAAAARGVLVSNVPGGRSRSAAEYALYLILALARRSWASTESWMAIEGMELSGRTLGILGLGRIGTHLAAFGSGLDMEILAYTRTPSIQFGVEHVRLVELFDRSDVVVCCLPGSHETEGLIDAKLLERLKPEALLVNVGRGSCLVTEDLLDVLLSGRLGGVGLDVTDPEPLPAAHGLREIDRVIITPHVAGHSDVASAHAIERFRANVMAQVNGEKPRDLVDGEY